jgi:hypothetical protein
MSFRLFIYYCALGGGWAAFLAWAIVQGAGIRHLSPPWLAAALTGGILGVLMAGALGTLDALLNAVGPQRLVRVGVCLVVGALGGFLGGLIGQLLRGVLERFLPSFLSPVLIALGWMLAGVFVGASVGVFDLVRAFAARQNTRAALKKTLNGVYGGLLGGFIGGVPFGFLQGSERLTRSNLTVGLVVLGQCVGLLVGLAQVILKEAWLKVEAGFRPGRELILSREETTIGRAESCDLGLFGDNAIERLHARILLRGQCYLLADAGTAAGTFLNEQRVEQPTPLHSGDAIRVGQSVLRFGERQKRAAAEGPSGGAGKTRSSRGRRRG